MDKQRFVQKIDAMRDASAVGWKQLADEFLRLSHEAVNYVPEGVDYCTLAVSQIPVEIFTPASSQGYVLFLHGGNYLLPTVDAYRAFANKLAVASGKAVVMPDYAVAPYRYPAAQGEVRTVWEWLYRQDDRVCLVGDGSGACMALQLALALRGEGARLPRAMVLMSPQVDMTASGDSYYDNYYLDVIYGKKKLSGLDIPDAYRHSELWAYADGADLASPDVSPLFADLEGLPPTHVVVGGHEVVLSDAVALGAALRRAGVDSRLTVGDGLFYAYPMFCRHFAEAAAAFDELSAFLRAH